MNTSTKKARPLAVHRKGSVSDETFDDFLAAEMKDRGLIHINATD